MTTTGTPPATYVLVHGAWHDARAWHRVIPLLTAAGHRVFAPSLTGRGDTAHLLGPDVGLDTHVADVVGLLIAEDLTDVVLVGHSYAGMVISAVANQVPDRIRQLVLDGGIAVITVEYTLCRRGTVDPSGGRVAAATGYPPGVTPTRRIRTGSGREPSSSPIRRRTSSWAGL